MPRELTFVAWRRPAVARRASGVSGGRTTATLPLTARATSPSGEVEEISETVTFHLAGPADLVGLAQDAVMHRHPAPGTLAAETTVASYVEFRDASLPWALTPAGDLEGGGLRPWVVLVVGTEDEITVVDDSVVIAASALAGLDLDTAASWAHVQQGEGPAFARVLNLRELAQDTDHLAVVVPGWRVDDGVLADAWTADLAPDDPPVELPCYDHWRFRTGPDGDFRSLARALRPHVPPADSGRIDVDNARRPQDEAQRLRGALAPVGSVDAPRIDEAVEDLSRLLDGRERETDDQGRPIIGLPIYGAAWRTDTRETAWGGELNHDPRARAAAGLGAALVRDHGDELAGEAASQGGAVETAATMLARLELGLTAGSELFVRRMPSDPAGQLAVLGPGLRAVRTDTGTLDARATAPDRALPAGWFSTAARRALRRGPARTAHAAADASDPAALFAAANRCPAPEPPATIGGPRELEPHVLRRWVDIWSTGEAPGIESLDRLLRDLAAAGLAPELIEELRRQLQSLADSDQPLPWLVVLAAWRALQAGPSEAAGLVAAERILERVRAGGPEVGQRTEDLVALVALLVGHGHGPSHCTPVDLDALAGGALEAFDPRRDDAAARREVLGRLDGVDPDDPFAPPAFCPGLDVETWRMLATSRPDWLLPGRGTIPTDAVVPAETNAVFTDALLVGLNTQLLHELRWRNLRISTGCTPVRTFWNRVEEGVADDPAAPDGARRLDDIDPLATWKSDEPLGDASHGPPAATGGDLVLIVRGQLLRRYPATLVYLVPHDQGDEDTSPGPLVDEQHAVFPTFRGRIGDDLSFLGFQGVPAEDLAAWWVVFEEAPTGLRFGRPDEGTSLPPDGAATADLLLERPVRVVLRGTDLIDTEGPSDE